MKTNEELMKDCESALKAYLDFWDRHSRPLTEAEIEEEDANYHFSEKELEDIKKLKVRIPLSEEKDIEEHVTLMENLRRAYVEHAKVKENQ
jgi:rhamnogalacturonyl hydrolase YesR